MVEDQGVSSPRLYYPVLNRITGSMIASMLWHQLEYWFWKMGKESIYKFVSPPKKDRGDYRRGDSWCEELDVTKQTFRRAFDKIGVRYESSTQRDMYVEENGSTSVFQNKMYYSCYSNANKKTFFYRDEEQIEGVIINEGVECCFDFEKKLAKYYEET